MPLPGSLPRITIACERPRPTPPYLPRAYPRISGISLKRPCVSSGLGSWVHVPSFVHICIYVYMHIYIYLFGHEVRSPLFGHEVEVCLACSGLRRGTASLTRYPST